MIGQFNLDTDGVKDLSIAALIAKMMGMADNRRHAVSTDQLLGMAGTAAHRRSEGGPPARCRFGNQRQEA